MGIKNEIPTGAGLEVDKSPKEIGFLAASECAVPTHEIDKSPEEMNFLAARECPELIND